MGNLIYFGIGWRSVNFYEDLEKRRKGEEGNPYLIEDALRLLGKLDGSYDVVGDLDSYPIFEMMFGDLEIYREEVGYIREIIQRVQDGEKVTEGDLEAGTSFFKRVSDGCLFRGNRPREIGRSDPSLLQLVA